MCGIVVVVRRPSARALPDIAALEADLADVLASLLTHKTPDRIIAAADRVAAVDRELRGLPGLQALLAAPMAITRIDGMCEALDREVATLESRLDDEGFLPVGRLEEANAALIRLKDAVWNVRRDRLRNVRTVAALAGPDAGNAAIEAMASVQIALSAIDRLEVRGRDSAGLHLMVWGHGLDLTAPGVAALVERRRDPLFLSGSVREHAGVLSFVYKAAAEIGELGDNTRQLREAITADELLHLALGSPAAGAAVLAHTRWASVGLIGQPNAHPLNSDADGTSNDRTPYVVAALNGDVDNHADLKAAEGLRIPVEITTDAKVIPMMVASRLADGLPPSEAFRRVVASFEGSVAISAGVPDEPNTVLLAQRGSGQGLYVGLAEDAFVVASEPYGLVEETSVYVRLDGETPSDPANPTGSRGQVVVLDGELAGELEGIVRLSYDGTALPVSVDDLQSAQITTRDIDRGAYPHFLLKEMVEAPGSWRKTLRGHLAEDDDGMLVASLGEETIPTDVAERLRGGAIDRIVVIGQGTAAVAGQSLALTLDALTDGLDLRVDATPATELSGFGMRPDMSDTLVIAISQSGTTTDTNRTVDVARSRGAAVIGIVNRRNSDLTERTDGVLYTSDGRDVEMSVASTKAFYAQVAAGILLACGIAEVVGAPDRAARAELLQALRDLPDAMRQVIAGRAAIADAAQRLAPSRRYWAVVGNGLNRVAAEEARIKLSELCYKSIACDATEDKKHIDLSSEPLILVCAAGLVGSNADDVAKEVAIYRAHKAAPIVIASDGDERFSAAQAVISVPEVHPSLAFVVSAMAGHLFAYEAALAIDAQARPLREARAAIEGAVEAEVRDDDLLGWLTPRLEPVARRFLDGLRSNAYDGHLEASTAVRVASLLRYATSTAPLDAYEIEHGRVGTPSAVVEDLSQALTRAVEELTRPIDAIKHQAKTVTVGISRSDETLLAVPLVQAVLDAGAPRDRLGYRSLRKLGALDAAVDAVIGFTRYRIDGDPLSDQAMIAVVDRGGIGRDLESRTERNPRLRGTKRRVAVEREVMAARGRSDGRTLVFVPEVKGSETTGITLLHVRWVDRLPAPAARNVLEGYGRYGALVDAVTETEPTFRDDLLGSVDVVDLLTESLQRLADRWRA
ncbi:MAG TPA: SIS domain-containing protein [Acidimicrobiales bacterium]|nr:SIS domain-containing protein [Acidimicrobiales bacterium]